MSTDELWGSGRGQDLRQGAGGGRKGAEAACGVARAVCSELWAEQLSLPCEAAMAWSDVYHSAQGTASKDGRFCLPVAKDAARVCASLKKPGLHLFSRCWPLSFIARGLGPVLSLAECREGHVPMVCGGDCSEFHSVEERVDQVGLGQTGVVWLTNRVNLLWDRQVAGIVPCQPEREDRKTLRTWDYFIIFLEAFWGHLGVVTFKGICSGLF